MPASSLLRHPPRDRAELSGFPEHALAAGTTLHRVHRAELGGWYFHGGEMWRFNPCRVEGLGACYLAEQPVTGLLETFKGLALVDEADLQARAHFSVVMDRTLRLADLCAAGAGGFGVNGEIHTSPDYALAQAWASALASADFQGVRYLCRSDPGMRLVGYALFDAAGVPEEGRWPSGTDRPIAEEIVAEAEAYGLRCRPAP